MDLIQLPPNSLRAGQVLTFSLRDAEGKLLVASGQTLPNTPQMQALLARPIWVLAHETKEYQRALAHKMDTMMLQGANLGDIVKVQADYKPDKVQRLDLGEQAAWADLQMHAHSLLRDPNTEDFRGRFQQLHTDAIARLSNRPDAILMFLIFDASQGFERYSARHALLCLALAEQCALKLGWPEDWRLALTQAALSMNISISAQQDRLAAQSDEPSHNQQQSLISHGDRSAKLLAELGAKSELWLKTVCLHHDAGPGPLAERAPAEQLARLLRRIDIFASRVSPRASRRAQPGAMAARAVFLDELKQPDEAGAAIVKTIGLYPLGSLVRLANGEVGIVFKRGHSATEPMVASLLGKSGNPLSEPVPRDTRLAAQAIAASLAPHELKLRVSMEKLLKMS
ncbi:HD-GYP domain-containing protein [Roseateles sp.]|uniref:HD-GYP domain-containing protein n=1 Tax=Roseateles sp. TaxID=1971397 RepID=UPI003BA71DB8